MSTASMIHEIMTRRETAKRPTEATRETRDTVVTIPVTFAPKRIADSEHLRERAAD